MASGVRICSTRARRIRAETADIVQGDSAGRTDLTACAHKATMVLCVRTRSILAHRRRVLTEALAEEADSTGSAIACRDTQASIATTKFKSAIRTHV